jgi:hypothetical protein
VPPFVDDFADGRLLARDVALLAKDLIHFVQDHGAPPQA